MECIVSKGWLKSYVKKTGNFFEQFNVWDFHSNDSHMGEEDFDEEHMRKYLSDIREAIQENRSSTTIFKKLERCEREIFGVYNTLRNLNMERSIHTKSSKNINSNVG